MASALHEKQEVDKSEAVLQEHHWTTEEFYRAAELGEFQDPDRLEIIHGRIIEIMPAGPLHATLSFDVAEQLRDALRSRFLIREERPIHLAFDSEPIPDIALVRGKSSDYRQEHPTPQEVALIVEVANTSSDYDLGGKSVLYAQAGIMDYWVVLVNELVVIRHREPSPEGYREVTRLAGSDALSPLAAPEAVWTVDALLGESNT